MVRLDKCFNPVEAAGHGLGLIAVKEEFRNESEPTVDCKKLDKEQPGMKDAIEDLEDDEFQIAFLAMQKRLPYTGSPSPEYDPFVSWLHQIMLGFVVFSGLSYTMFLFNVLNYVVVMGAV